MEVKSKKYRLRFFGLSVVLHVIVVANCEHRLHAGRTFQYYRPQILNTTGHLFGGHYCTCATSSTTCIQNYIYILAYKFKSLQYRILVLSSYYMLVNNTYLVLKIGYKIALILFSMSFIPCNSTVIIAVQRACIIIFIRRYIASSTKRYRSGTVP